MWSDNRNRLLVGRVAMLVYIYFNHRQLHRASAPALNSQDWEAFMDFLESQPPMEGVEA